MGERTTPLQIRRRGPDDLLERVARNPQGVLITFRGKRHAFVCCPGCGDWYWRIYHTDNTSMANNSKQAYCSDRCAKERQALLKKARVKRWRLKNPGYQPPCRRKSR